MVAPTIFMTVAGTRHFIPKAATSEPFGRFRYPSSAKPTLRSTQRNWSRLASRPAAPRMASSLILSAAQAQRLWLHRNWSATSSQLIATKTIARLPNGDWRMRNTYRWCRCAQPPANGFNSFGVAKIPRQIPVVSRAQLPANGFDCFGLGWALPPDNHRMRFGVRSETNHPGRG